MMATTIAAACLETNCILELLPTLASGKPTVFDEAIPKEVESVDVHVDDFRLGRM
jgi:hypothetical protein